MAIELYRSSDRFAGNEPGPTATLFAAPEQYPPTRLSRFDGVPCAFGCGDPSHWMVLGYTPHVGTTGTPVCDGHRIAVMMREATWI